MQRAKVQFNATQNGDFAAGTVKRKRKQNLLTNNEVLRVTKLDIECLFDIRRHSREHPAFKCVRHIFAAGKKSIHPAGGAQALPSKEQRKTAISRKSYVIEKTNIK